MQNNSSVKTKIRTLVVLVSLAIIGILAFQLIGLLNSYRLSKQQTEINIKKALEGSIVEYKQIKADTARRLLKQLIRSDKDFNFSIFRYPGRFQAGYRYGNRAYVTYPVDAATGDAIEKDAYMFIQDKINTLPLDDLRALYSALVGGRDYPPNSPDDKMAYHLMLIFNDTYTDIRLMTRIVKRTFAANGIAFDGKLRYFTDIKGLYNIPKPKPQPLKQDVAVEERSIAVGVSFEPPPVKIKRLEEYIKQRNAHGDTTYTAQPLYYDINDLFTDKLPVLLLAVKTPVAYTVKNMLLSVIGSLLLMLFLGFCIVYTLYLLIREKKLSAIKNDFISNISHELKTPVATALAAVQGMRYFDMQKDAVKAEQYLDTASAELQRLSGMVTKILSSSVFESTQFAINPATLNLDEMINSILTAARLSHPGGAFTLIYTATGQVFADKEYLYQAISNLVDNATKYSGSKANIRIECMAVKNGIEINVTDNGPGIAPEYRALIFDKFFRVPSTDGHIVKGYGLGLNYVKAIVEKHGGSITLKTAGANGSTFTLFLPQ